MYQQRQPGFLHFFQRSVAQADVRYAFIRIGCRSCRVQLDTFYEAALMGSSDLIGRRIIGKVKGHQRLEIGTFDSCENSIEVIDRLFHGGDRGLQIRHYNSALELFCRKWGYTIKYITITQMEMPVIRAGYGNAFGRHGEMYYVPCDGAHKVERLIMFLFQMARGGA